MNTELQPITYDLIHTMRLQGRHEEAYRLIQAHQRNMFKGKAILAKEIRSQDNKKLKATKKHAGLCTYGHCENPAKKKGMCCEHNERSRLYNQKKKASSLGTDSQSV